MSLKQKDEIIHVFKNQDLENGYFDVTFEVEGKLIHAHKFMLAPISTTFKSMFSTNWNKEETIPITTYCYDDFFEFLTFIYSGKCDLNDENIFAMIDISEFYQVNNFKKCCDAYLSMKKYNSENVHEFLKAFMNYLTSLPLFEKRIISEVKKHYPDILESDQFITLPKDIVEKIVDFKDRLANEELLFQKVYEWAEHQVNIRNHQQQNEDNFDLNEAIKTEITPFLSNIRFKNMELSFLHDYVVKRGFLFSNDELNEIFESAIANVKVRVTNSSGRSIYGFLPYNSEAINVIKSLKNCCNHSTTSVGWNPKCKIPSTPSPFKKRDGIEWYLCYFYSGWIGVRRHDAISEKNYLLAEMNMEISGFQPDAYCKIQIE